MCMKTDNRQTEQSRRIMFAFNEFLKGKVLTTRELHDKIKNEFRPEITLRTVQRDLRVLQECVPLLEQWKEGKQVYWQLSRNYIKPNNIPVIESSDLFSFHILKAHLKSFKGTVIEQDVEKLKKKLEKLAPGHAFYDECLFWDQNFGTFDYSNYNQLLENVISFIVNKTWAHVRYYSVKQGTEKSYDCYFEGLFAYSGTVYVVTYFPYFEHHEALQLQGIKHLEQSYNKHEVPEFDFTDFTEKRFGVYSSKPLDIKLKIKKKYAGYFAGRKWHKTQKENYDKQGNLIIEMTVPIGMDLVAWIMGWNEAIKVIKPKALREKVIAKMKLGLRNYESLIST